MKRKGEPTMQPQAVTQTDHIVVPRALPKRRVEDIPEPPRARWIAVITEPNRELDANRNIREAGFWTFYPQRLVPRSHARQDDFRSVAYLTGYIFAQILPRQDWTVIEHRPAVIAVLTGSNGNPALLQDKDVAALQVLADPDGLVKEPPKPAALRVIYDPGERVRIVEGPFAAFAATVTDGVDNSGFLGVEAELFGRAASMRLPAGWVKRAG